MEYIGLKYRPTFIYDYLNPLLEKNKLQMTVPDKPKSRNQKYITILQKQYAGEKLRNNREFALKCIGDTSSHAFKYLGENLKNDKEFIIELVKEARNVYPLLDEASRNDKDIAIVISQVWEYIEITV